MPNNRLLLLKVDEIMLFLRYMQFVVLKKNVYLCDDFKSLESILLGLSLLICLINPYRLYKLKQ